MNCDEYNVNWNFLLENNGLFRERRECRDSVYTCFYFAQHLQDVGAGRNLRGYSPTAFAGSAGNPYDSLNVLDSLLDLNNDALFNFLGSGSEVSNPHLNVVELKIGSRLFSNGEN